MKKKDGDGTPSDEVELLVQKLRWLRLPGMAKLVASILERAAKDNLSTLDVVHRLCDEEKSRVRPDVDHCDAHRSPSPAVSRIFATTLERTCSSAT